MSENTITIPLNDVTQAGLKAVLAFAGTDSGTPVLCGVQVTNRRFIATDRYAVGSFTYDWNVEAEETEPFVVHTELVTWITKHKIEGEQRLILTDTTATIVWNDDSIAASASTRQNLSTFNVPPVARLIPDRSDEAVDGIAPFAITPALLTKLTKAATALIKYTGKNAPWRFQVQVNGGYKLAPIRASLADERMVALLQPSLILR